MANSLDGTVSRINPVTNAVTAVIATGNGPTAVAANARGVWVSNQFDGTLVRIDPRTNQVVRQMSVGNRPQGMAIAGGNLLVSVRQSGARHSGGTLRMLTSAGAGPDSIDTAVAYNTVSWPILRMANDGLVAFDQASGLAGTQPVPDLTESLPTPTEGGRTYSFRLRPNVRYSNGKLVQASDFRSTFERDFKIGLPVAYYDGIVGAARCEKSPKHCDLSQGIVANDAARTVTFHLVTADPEFLDKLALPFAYVVPAGTSPRAASVHPLPATGPYMIASYRPEKLLKLVRNRYFHEWSKAAQPDGYPDAIVVHIGRTPNELLSDVIRGKADIVSTWGSGTPSPGRVTAIKTRYASQVRFNPQPSTTGLFLNTRLAPFDRLTVRRALNYAADRVAAVRAAGGPDQAQTTCQILPPDFPGYRPYCPYTAGSTTRGTWTAPNLAKARGLVARSGTRSMKITVWSWSGVAGLGPYAVKLLRSLGYRASTKVLGDTYFSTVSNSRARARIGFTSWVADYPAAPGFLQPLLSCAAFIPNSQNNRNFAQFCDPNIDRQMERAVTEQETSPDAARGAWERVDRQMVDQAPWVPLVNPKTVDVLSKRVGNYQYSPAEGVLIDQLWVR